MVMDRLHDLEQQNKQQQADLQEQQKQLQQLQQLSPEDPSHLVASVVREFLGTRNSTLRVVYLQTNENGVRIAAPWTLDPTHMPFC